jgi:hypothetical protein
MRKTVRNKNLASTFDTNPQNQKIRSSLQAIHKSFSENYHTVDRPTPTRTDILPRRHPHSTRSLDHSITPSPARMLKTRAGCQRIMTQYVSYITSSFSPCAKNQSTESYKRNHNPNSTNRSLPKQKERIDIFNNAPKHITVHHKPS